MIFKRTLILALMAIAVSSCTMINKEQVKRPVDSPEVYKSAFLKSDLEGIEAMQCRWWLAFNDEKLKAIIEEAFLSNPSLLQKLARFEQYVASFRVSRSRQLPGVSAEANALRSRTPLATGHSTAESQSLSLAANFEVDLWSKIRNRKNAARYDALATKQDVYSMYLSLSAELASLYYLAIEQRAQLALTNNTIRSFETVTELVEQRYKEGLVSAVDVYHARQTLNATRARAPQLEASLAQTEHAISILLGRYPERGTSGELKELPKLSETFPVGIPSTLLKTRPDIEAALLRLKASDRRVSAAIADRFPAINLIANYGESRTILDPSNITGIYFNAIAQAAMPLLDWGGRRNEVKRSKAVFKEKLERYKEVVLIAFKEVEDALVKNRTIEEEI
ncbi:MAG: efflux transporter outer membrane subunit, partial [Deltaproteobacteria bacterium]|nr:efflux transporter outer membrane subunit [Deltaproteobacteria bacterium]